MTTTPDSKNQRTADGQPSARHAIRLRSTIARRMTVAALLVAAAIPAGLLSRPWWSNNLGILDPGRVIRSAQPTNNLGALIGEYRLASILNLRGGSFRDPWYAHEVRTAEEHGVAFFDLPLGATRRPTRRELLQLIDTISSCKYPLLIHCKAGADRTGLASVIYLMMQKSEPPRQALRAFTIYHGHLPLFGTEHLHEPIDEYAGWLEERRLEHTPERFREWVRDEYRSADPAAEPPPLPSGPRPGAEPRRLAGVDQSPSLR